MILFFFLPVVLECSALIFDLYAQSYTLDKTCASFYSKLWLHYYITEDFIKSVIKSFLRIMLALCLMLSETYYAQA